MMYSSIASKYALALYNVSKINQKTDEYKERLNVFVNIYNELSVFLNNQAIKPVKRSQLVCDIMSELGFKPDEVFGRFVYLLISNKRMKYIKQIATLFDYAILEENGLVPVEVISATDLNDEEKSALTEFVRKYTSKTPVFSVKVDEGIIAGVVVEFYGKRYDASIKGRLEKLARDVLRREG
ncbi:MAG: F0F1 ATP synthase subunit delta [Fervidobacterium sp.]|uniref:ATP synthase subunit delta n=1 Tax=Fervidobacterium gondwanense DSM 13020 TaxID=1121883 RepID=A0A1M7SC26_FERGO|nr:F0F1 ATP synthase subunit delta [Fervidobacterium gondwanense]UXF01260.1 ATP synthase subunit delta [Fervidobacterium riparium]SHN56067.1 ATP synthase F1 subcomplex delta subunit [Fervidobacterium gondwanense DSM 13020]